MSKYIDTNMIITTLVEEKRKKIEETILGETYKVTEQIGVHVDKEKLKQWLEMCAELEKIDESQRIDDAIRNKFKEKDDEIAKLKQQLTERDTEIEFLAKQNKALVKEEDLLDKKLKELGVDCIEDLYKVRHQVCEEIRERADYLSYGLYKDGSASYTIKASELDKIQQGE